jgi:hypothetical protein
MLEASAAQAPGPTDSNGTSMAGSNAAGRTPEQPWEVLGARRSLLSAHTQWALATTRNTGAFLAYIGEVAFDGERIGCND